MVKRVSTEDSVGILDNLWKGMTVSQKKTLLKARGLHTSWSKAKTMKEVVARGGGMAANSLLGLVREHKKRNPKLKEVRF